jgi:hypothetical protein
VKIHALSIAGAMDYISPLPDWNQGPAWDAHNKMKGVAGPDPGNDITAILEPTNVVQTSVTDDSLVGTSLVKFHTDGNSPVILICEAGPGEEGGDSQYVGDRTAINAFEVTRVGP